MYMFEKWPVGQRDIYEYFMLKGTSLRGRHTTHDMNQAAIQNRSTESLIITKLY